MEIVKNWYERYFAFAGLKLVIARKGPRMIELGRQKGWVAKFRNEHIVSDHALPFLTYQSYPSIAIADDAIYYGSTFERIYSYVLTRIALSGEPLSRDKIIGVPAVYSANAKQYILTDSIFEYTPYPIKNEEIPYYINTLISEFQYLGKPYDVEFPLFYHNTSNEVADDDQVDILLKKLKEELVGRATVEDAYELAHLQSGSQSAVKSWTLLLNNLSSAHRHSVSPEFRKIRFFKSGQRLCIASFAPHILTDSMLVEDSPLFRATPLAPLWTKVWREAFLPAPAVRTYRPEYDNYLLHNSDDPKIREIRWNEQVKEYLYHRSCSLLIWANYLLSYALLLDVKRELDAALKAGNWNANTNMIDEADVALLIGNELAKEITNQLRMIYMGAMGNIQLPLVPIEAFSRYEYLPEKYNNDFVFHNQVDFAKCNSVSELISCNYSNQHRFLELATRRGEESSYERLCFGESFTSLQLKVGAYFTDSCVFINLHKAMDMRIDMGSVVPKYVRLGEHADAPWLRLFRSGENEDKYKDQLLRVVWYMFKVLMEEYKSSVFPEDMIMGCFNLVAANLAEEGLFNQLMGISFEVKYDSEKGKYRTFFLNETGCKNQKRDLLQFVVDYQLLTEDKNKAFWALNSTDYTNYLDGGTILDITTSNLIANYVRMACLICKSSGFDGLREIYNWLTLKDGDDFDHWFENELTQWAEQVFLPALKEDLPNINMNRIYDLILCFPSLKEISGIKAKINGMLDKDSLEGQAVSVAGLFKKIEARMQSARERKLFMELDKKVDIYYRLAFLAIEKFILKDSRFVNDEIDELANLLLFSEDKEKDFTYIWLQRMRQPDFFDNERDEDVKSMLIKLMQYPVKSDYYEQRQSENLIWHR